MKRFIRNILVFSALPILVLLTILTIYRYKKNTFDERHRHIAHNHHTLIMGDSQMQRLPPEKINDSTYNFASISEHYYFTHLKLKKILSFEEHRIETILLGVSIHNFSPVFRKAFDINTPEGLSSFGRYLPYINWCDSEFMHFGPKSFLGRAFINAVTKDEFLDWGYFKSEKSNPDEAHILPTLKQHYGDAGNNDHESQTKYLNEIVNLCQSENIRLVFVSTPVHPLYRAMVEEKYFTRLAEYIYQYPNIEYHNFLGVDTNPHHLADANHLNVTGGAVYAERIRERLGERRRDDVFLP